MYVIQAAKPEEEDDGEASAAAAEGDTMEEDVDVVNINMDPDEEGGEPVSCSTSPRVSLKATFRMWLFITLMVIIRATRLFEACVDASVSSRSVSSRRKQSLLMRG